MGIWNLSPSGLRAHVPDALPMGGGGDLERTQQPRTSWSPCAGGGIIENRVVERLRRQRLLWHSWEWMPHTAQGPRAPRWALELRVVACEPGCADRPQVPHLASVLQVLFRHELGAW